MDCCDVNISNIFNCPRCDEKGRPVQLITVESMMLPKLSNLISEKKDYYFCYSAKCDVAYFNDEKEMFTKYDLKERATQKFNDSDVKTCFCFNVTKGEIVDELKATGDCNVINLIKAKMRDHGCFCETSNPEGSCCLANNIAYINEQKQKLEVR
jgi:hypothetical protein